MTLNEQATKIEQAVHEVNKYIQRKENLKSFGRQNTDFIEKHRHKVVGVCEKYGIKFKSVKRILA